MKLYLFARFTVSAARIIKGDRFAHDMANFFQRALLKEEIEEKERREKE